MHRESFTSSFLVHVPGLSVALLGLLSAGSASAADAMEQARALIQPQVTVSGQAIDTSPAVDAHFQAVRLIQVPLATARSSQFSPGPRLDSLDAHQQARNHIQPDWAALRRTDQQPVDESGRAHVVDVGSVPSP